MEVKNCTPCQDEEVKRLTFSRYVKITSLVDLLKGRVFVPTFATLLKADPEELAIPAYSNDWLERDFFSIPEFEQTQGWLQAQWENQMGQEFRAVEDVRDRILMEQWMKEVAHRRCTWCWFVSLDCTEESIAMWNLYAREGVLVRTNWKAIQEALAGEARYEAGLFEVDYVSVGDHDEKFKSPDNLRRPFLFKSKGYKHEQEIRIVFQDEGKWLHPGIELAVEPKTLIKQLTFSPYLSRPEFESLRRLVPSLPGVVIDHSQRGFGEDISSSLNALLEKSATDLPAPIKIL